MQKKLRMMDINHKENDFMLFIFSRGVKMKKHGGKHLGEFIDFYVAMNMDGISELNDLAGGVTVTLEDDFSSIDPAMTKGTTLTLQ